MQRSHSAATGSSTPASAGNSLLDVLVGGCTVDAFVTVISATQPDQGGYRLQTSGGHVTGCSDSTGKTVDLATCLKAASYSSALTFAAGRVIFKS